MMNSVPPPYRLRDATPFLLPGPQPYFAATLRVINAEVRARIPQTMSADARLPEQHLKEVGVLGQARCADTQHGSRPPITVPQFWAWLNGVKAQWGTQPLARVDVADPICIRLLSSPPGASLTQKALPQKELSDLQSNFDKRTVALKRRREHTKAWFEEFGGEDVSLTKVHLRNLRNADK